MVRSPGFKPPWDRLTVDAVSDEFMREMLAKATSYTVVVLKRTPRRDEAGADAVVWEHGRRNFELRKEGKLRVVLPLGKERELSGISIFSTGVEETKALMDEDPAVKAGIFTYEIYRTRSFAEDSLGGA